MNNDKNSIETIELFLNEKSRKYYTNENLYFSNFVKLMEGVNLTSYRILYSPREKIMTFHHIDLSNEFIPNDYIENCCNIMEVKIIFIIEAKPY